MRLVYWITVAVRVGKFLANPNKNIQVELTTFSQTLGSIEDVEKLAFGKNDYHFILCDKMVCELISKEVLPINAYAIMAKKLTAFLHENGLLIMLDVTTKDEPWIFTVQYYYLVFVVRADRIEAFVTKAASCVKS